MWLANNRQLFLVYTGWILLLALIAAFTIDKFQLNTNILHLLPKQERKAFIEKAIDKQASLHGNTVIWLIGSNDIESGFTAAKNLEKRLQKSELFASIQVEIEQQDQASGFEKMLEWKQQFLTTEDRLLLKANPDTFIEKRYKALFSPAAMQRLSLIEKDPLFIMGEYFSSMSPLESAEPYKDIAVFRHKDMNWALLTSKIPESGLTIRQQNRLVKLTKSLEMNYQKQGLQLLYTGLPIYSAYGAVSAESEISSVGLASITLIIIVFVLVFLSIRPLLIALFSIGSGILSAIIICTAIFGEIHMITLVFGSSLIGISVDYALHYLCDHHFNQGQAINNKQQNKTLHRVFRGITLGMVSSVVTYSALSLTPFPGLQQIAVFAGAGLFASWLTVCTLFPRLTGKLNASKPPPLNYYYTLLLHQWPLFAKRFRTPILLLIVVFSVTGFYQLQSDDDIRNMQSVDQSLLQKEQKIRSILNQHQGSRFFVVTGNSIENVIKKEQKLKQLLQNLIDDKKLEAYRAISDIYYSPSMQKQNQMLYQQALLDSGRLKAFLEKLNMQTGLINKIIQQEIETANNSETLDIAQWLLFVNGQWQANWAGCHQTCASIINIHGEKNLAYLEKIANSNPDIYFVDQVNDISQLLGEYRYKAGVYVSFALLGILLAIAFNLGIKSALWIMCVPLSAIILTIASLGHINGAYSLFNVFALLLVLGISLDYSIFHHISGSHQKPTSLAITLSLITSLLAFGMLSLSETHVIHAFGVTLALGISYAFLLSPLIPVRSLEVSHEHTN